MQEYTDKEIELAKRIYDATMLVSTNITNRKAKNIAKKLNLPTPSNLPDTFCLETARILLKHYDENLSELMQKAAEKM